MEQEQKDRPESFFAKEYRKLASFVRSYIQEVGERDEEDIIQDVMLSLLNRMEIAGPVEDLSAFIYGSLRNRIIDYYRKKNPIPVSDESVQLLDGRENPEDRAQSDEFQLELERSLESLPPPMRTVFVLVEMEGLTHREVAEQLEIPLGTALTLNREAKRRLRQELKYFNER